MENRICVLRSRTYWIGLLPSSQPFPVQKIPPEPSDPQTHPLVLITVSVIDNILSLQTDSRPTVCWLWLLHVLPITERILSDVSMSRSHPVDNAGFLSFTTFVWMTPMMWAMFRNKLDMSSISLSPLDVADTSGERSDTLLADSWEPHVALLSFDAITV